MDRIPSIEVPKATLAVGIGVLDLFTMAGLAPSKSEARRLVQQGGASANDRRISDEKAVIDASWLDSQGALLLRAGKKRVFRIISG